MSIDWEKIKSGALEKDRQQYDSMKSNAAGVAADLLHSQSSVSYKHLTLPTKRRV